MGTTARGLDYPEPTALVTEGAAAMRALAEDVDALVTGVEGLLDGRLDTLEARQHVSALVDAKGDVLVGSAADVLARLVVGSSGTVLTADPAAALGVKWAAVVAAKVATGSYTGDQTASRVIALPFTPSLVLLWGNPGGTTVLRLSDVGPSLFAQNDAVSWGMALQAAQSPSVSTDDRLRPRRVTNGFAVAYQFANDTNASAATPYRYVALSL